MEPKPAPPIKPAENTGKRNASGKPQPYQFHGRSFLSVLEDEHPEGFDEAYASHTFHEITMYYPMRCITSGNYKYIFNIAHPLIQVSIGNRCPFHRGEMASSSAYAFSKCCFAASRHTASSSSVWDGSEI